MREKGYSLVEWFFILVIVLLMVAIFLPDIIASQKEREKFRISEKINSRELLTKQEVAWLKEKVKEKFYTEEDILKEINSTKIPKELTLQVIFQEGDKLVAGIFYVDRKDCWLNKKEGTLYLTNLLTRHGVPMNRWLMRYYYWEVKRNR